MQRSAGNNIPLFLVLLLFPAIILSSCKDKQANNNVVVTAPAVPGAGMPQLSEIHLRTEEQLRTDSLNTVLRAELAASYYANHELEKAAGHYLTILRIDDKNTTAMVNLGNIYYDLGQDEKAVEYYGKALKLEKWNFNARCDMATCYRRMKKPDTAISLLRENIKLNFNHAQSHYNLAVILKDKGKIEEADAEMIIYQKLTSGSN